MRKRTLSFFMAAIILPLSSLTLNASEDYPAIVDQSLSFDDLVTKYEQQAQNRSNTAEYPFALWSWQEFTLARTLYRELGKNNFEASDDTLAKLQDIAKVYNEHMEEIKRFVQNPSRVTPARQQGHYLDESHRLGAYKYIKHMATFFGKFVNIYQELEDYSITQQEGRNLLKEWFNAYIGEPIQDDDPLLANWDGNFHPPASIAPDGNFNTYSEDPHGVYYKLYYLVNGPEAYKKEGLGEELLADDFYETPFDSYW